jgi:hypothetical protein
MAPLPLTALTAILQHEAMEKRPKIDVHSFDLKRKMLEKGYMFHPSARAHSRHRQQHGCHPQL